MPYMVYLYTFRGGNTDGLFCFPFKKGSILNWKNLSPFRSDCFYKGNRRAEQKTENRKVTKVTFLGGYSYSTAATTTTTTTSQIIRTNITTTPVNDVFVTLCVFWDYRYY